MDKRIQNTYTSLSKALFGILQTSTYDEITVNDLCEAAGIKRPTFYNHFENKNDFIIKSFRFHINSIIKRDYLENSISVEEFLFKIVIRYIYDFSPYRRKSNEGFERDFYFTPFNYLVDEFYDILFQFFKKRDKNVLNESEAYLLLYTYANAAVGNIVCFFFHSENTPQFYVKTLNSLINKIKILFKDVKLNLDML